MTVSNLSEVLSLSRLPDEVFGHFFGVLNDWEFISFFKYLSNTSSFLVLEYVLVVIGSWYASTISTLYMSWQLGLNEVVLKGPLVNTWIWLFCYNFLCARPITLTIVYEYIFFCCNFKIWGLKTHLEILDRYHNYFFNSNPWTSGFA